VDVDALLYSTLEGLGVPVKRLKYDGKAETYIEYALVVVRDVFYSDDDSGAEEYTYRADIYSKIDYLPLMRRMKQALKAAGFYNVTFDPEIYESDTRYYHVPAEFKYTTTTQTEV
jgi:hypothetical protein